MPQPNAGKRINDAGLAIIKKSESCVLHAYRDPGSDDGLPITIGWGTTRINGQPVDLGRTCTREEADRWLALDVSKADGEVARLVTVPLNENQFGALSSFDYNVGVGNFQSSTLLRLLNAGDYAGAAGQFGRWINGASGPLPGLVTRRAAEKALFLTPVAQVAPAPRLLHIGCSRGPDVVALQTKLASASLYRGRIDGDFGAGTQAAVVSWQKAHPECGEPDGIVGALTRGSLRL